MEHLNRLTMTATTTKLLTQLSKPIQHVGYSFHFAIKPVNEVIYAGFFLSICHSSSRYKKEAYKLGFWAEKRAKYQTNAVYTPLLVGIPLFFDDDQELHVTLKALLKYVITQFGYVPIGDQTPVATIETAYSDITPLQLM